MEPVLEYSTGPWDGQPTRCPSRKRKLTEASGINEALRVPLQAMERSRPSQIPFQWKTLRQHHRLWGTLPVPPAAQPFASPWTPQMTTRPTQGKNGQVRECAESGRRNPGTSWPPLTASTSSGTCTSCRACPAIMIGPACDARCILDLACFAIRAGLLGEGTWQVWASKSLWLFWPVGSARPAASPTGHPIWIISLVRPKCVWPW